MPAGANQFHFDFVALANTPTNKTEPTVISSARSSVWVLCLACRLTATNRLEGSRQDVDEFDVAGSATDDRIARQRPRCRVRGGDLPELRVVRDRPVKDDHDGVVMNTRGALLARKMLTGTR